MEIRAAQQELRTRFVGGFFGQLVSGLLWLGSAALATWGTPRAAISLLVVGGFFIFPCTEVLIRLTGERQKLSIANPFPQLGMQVAFVLPLSMPLLLPVGRYRLEWFFPAMMILLGAHYLPFVFLYGMRMFAALAGLLVGAGMVLALSSFNAFDRGAWFTGVVLLVFAALGKSIADRERTTGISGGPP